MNYNGRIAQMEMAIKIEKELKKLIEKKIQEVGQ